VTGLTGKECCDKVRIEVGTGACACALRATGRAKESELRRRWKSNDRRVSSMTERTMEEVRTMTE
jgi:hypothetical protein